MIKQSLIELVEKISMKFP
jgi:serine/threonine-protein kinase mTOR